MSKQLISVNDIYGVTALDGVPVVSSRKIAEIFGKEHKNVLRAIENCECSSNFTQLNFKLSTYKDSTGRKLPEYLLTKDGFTFVVMGFTGKKAAQFKEAYINRFNEMERFIFSRNIARLEYPELTAMIKAMHEEPKFYHFSNEADMINAIVTGMKAKQIREKYGIAKEDPIRDYLPAWQVDAIQRLQKVDVGLVIAMPDFQERKKALQAYFDKLYNLLALPKLSA